MAKNVVLGPDDKWSRYEVLSWLNDMLQTEFTQVEQLCSGTPFISLTGAAVLNATYGL